MTNVQFYFAIAMPTLAALAGILTNAVMFNSLSTRMNHLETRMDLLISKVADMDTRLSRLEERFEGFRR